MGCIAHLSDIGKVSAVVNLKTAFEPYMYTYCGPTAA
jgi:hypothetical protein